MNLKIIIGSTRPGRKGPLVANWFAEYAKQHSNFNVEIIDLKEINLPLFDEAEHPMTQKYAHTHTQKWSQAIADGDAFVMVTPEYNHSYPASIKNAFDYLHKEWKEKPMGFVSYAGVSAGTRAVSELKLSVATMSMMPLVEAVNIPFFWNFITEEGQFKPNEVSEKAADTMLTQLTRWATALKTMREA